MFTTSHGETDAFNRHDIAIVDHEVIHFNVMSRCILPYVTSASLVRRQACLQA